ncbi:Rab proteins geranylgeranyltransferase component A [Clarireedia jacksonii]
MKFLKFVVDYENQPEVWQSHAEKGLSQFLAEEFKFPEKLQTLMGALTLSLESLERTMVDYALPRIQRHLTSIGVFGPGFGAVVPKWGGGAEIAQVGCRACAVGGGVYVLGTGIQDVKIVEAESITSHEVELSNAEVIKTNFITRVSNGISPDGLRAAKIMAVVSSSLTTLFTSTVEGSPIPAVSVVVFPAKIISTAEAPQPYPVYIMAHSSETGECPAGQCVLYVTTLLPNSSDSESGKTILNKILSTFLSNLESAETELLYSVYYEQQGTKGQLDLAFNDQVLEDVETEWRRIVSEDGETRFMVFEERNTMGDDDEGEEF